jgi:hypothetical protein
VLSPSCPPAPPPTRHWTRVARPSHGWSVACGGGGPTAEECGHPDVDGRRLHTHAEMDWVVFWSVELIGGKRKMIMMMGQERL